MLNTCSVTSIPQQAWLQTNTMKSISPKGAKSFLFLIKIMQNSVGILWWLENEYFAENIAFAFIFKYTFTGYWRSIYNFEVLFYYRVVPIISVLYYQSFFQCKLLLHCFLFLCLFLKQSDELPEAVFPRWGHPCLEFMNNLKTEIWVCF